MLKPKRKITKQEIKKDPFLEFINDSQQWIQERKKIIYQVAFVVIAVIMLVIFVNNNKSKSSAESEALLGKAQLYQDLGDVENAKFQLQTLVDDFDGTKAGIEGKYYLGKLLLEEGDAGTASEYLNDFVKKGKNLLLKTTAYKYLAEMSLKNGDMNKTEELLQSGVKSSENTVYHNEMLLLLANQLFENGKSGKATKIIDDIFNQKDIPLTIKKATEELAGKIKGETT